MAGRHPDPARTPLADLWVKHWEERSPETRAALMAHYLPMVWRVSLDIPTSRKVERADLVQDGTFGLAEAIDRFDPDNPAHAGFGAFAQHRIRGAMIDAARKFDETPQSVRRNAKVVDNAVDQLRDTLNRWPTPAEVAARIGWTPKRLRQVVQQQARSARVSTEAAFGLDLGVHVSDIIGDPYVRPYGEGLEAEDMARYLADAQLRCLNAHTRFVLDLYYRQGINLADIGARLGVTESRVCQIVAKGSKQLRAAIGHHLR